MQSWWPLVTSFYSQKKNLKWYLCETVANIQKAMGRDLQNFSKKACSGNVLNSGSNVRFAVLMSKCPISINIKGTSRIPVSWNRIQRCFYCLYIWPDASFKMLYRPFVTASWALAMVPKWCPLWIFLTFGNRGSHAEPSSNYEVIGKTWRNFDSFV